MLNAKSKTNRNLFALLFFALACDLGARYANPGLDSADMASTSEIDKTCLETGRCEVKRGDETTIIEVKRAKRQAVSNPLFPTPAPAPVPVPALVQRERVDVSEATIAASRKSCPAKAGQAAVTKCRAEVNAAKKAIKDAEEANSAAEAAERANKVARERALEARNRQGTPAEEEVFEMSFDTALAADCNDGSCRVQSSPAIPVKDIKNLTELTAKLKEQRLKHEAEVKARREAYAKLKKEEEAKKKAQAKLEKDQAECRVGPDGETGKDWSESARMECRFERIAEIDGKNKSDTYAKRMNEYNTHLRNDLRKMIESGSPEERAEGIALARQVSRDRGLPAGIRETAGAMAAAGAHQTELTDLRDQLAKLPPGSPAHSALVSRLTVLHNNATYDMNHRLQVAMMTGNKELVTEYSLWSGILTQSSLAVLQSGTSVGVGSHAGQRQTFDANLYQRTARGIPGDQLIHSQTGFDGLTNRLNQDIQNIGRAGQGLMPGQQLPGQQQFPVQRGAIDPRTGRPAFTPGTSTPSGVPAGQQPGFRPTARGRS